MQNLLDVFQSCQFGKYFKLLQLDVDWIVKVAEKNFDLFLNNVRSFLNYQVDVLQGYILNFWLFSKGQERNQRSR